MKICILGAGFTGLAAAHRLQKNGHRVTIYEKQSDVGGLAIGLRKPQWEWTLEKGYHHWFTNDDAILKLVKEVGHNVIIKRPHTDVFVNGKILSLDSPLSLIKFPYLPAADKLKLSLCLLYLKCLKNYQSLEGQKALPWIRKYMGHKNADLIWDPLFTGKFGSFKEDISLIWFWARIKKRTTRLAYPEGGFKKFADRVAEEVKSLGGEINLNSDVGSLKINSGKVLVKVNGKTQSFDKVIVTMPSPLFVKITPDLKGSYTKKILSIKHLHAQVLMLTLNKRFFKKTYWLNITHKDFPFLVLAEHTNFMSPKNYGGQHILYIGNYLSSDHSFLKMTAKQLLKKFDPYLRRLNQTYSQSVISYQLFMGPFAQPIVTPHHQTIVPKFKTPIKNIYLANLDMVYPWDRGTNYAVELGEKVAKYIENY